MLAFIQALAKPVILSRYLNKGLLLLCLLSFNISASFAQSCPVNIDFELGNFQNWQCYVGSTTVGVGNKNLITVATSAATTGRHTIIPKGTLKDPICGIPMSAPNGSNFSIQLGNNGTGAQAERVTYLFTVPQGQQDFVITYQYAVVLEDPSHPAEQQPRFSAKVFDVDANAYISCGSFDYVATSSLPGFTRAANSDVLYKNWTPVTLRLSGYGGKKVLLEFTTADCTPGGHFGYAYVDVNANCSTVITGSDYCAGTPAVNLQAPAGYETYNWYNADRSKLLGTGSNLFMSPAPADGTSIVLDIVPYAGFGCNNTITAVIHAKPAINFTVKDPAPVCAPAVIDLTDKKLLGTSDPTLNYTYWQDSLATVTVYAPKTVSVSGTYYIQAASSTCAEVKPVHVVVNSPPQFTITNPATVCISSFVDITARNIKSDTTVTYTYWKDNQASIPLSAPDHIVSPNTYYIKGTIAGGCFTIKPVVVTFFPLPVLNIHDPAAVCYPSTVDISNQSVTTGSDPNLKLTYYTDSTAIVPLDHYDQVGISGTYYIKAVNINGCQIIKPVKVIINPLPKLIITNPPYVCLMDKVDITASAVTAGSSNIAQLTYWKDTLATVALTTPKAVADSGVYYIKATSPDGCEMVKSVLVTIHNPPVVKITDPTKVYQPTKVDLTAPAIIKGSSPRVTYSYWYNEGATIAIPTPKLIDRTATYYIKGTSEYGCYTIMPVNIVVAEIPEIKIPTAFTPTRTSNNRLYPFLIGVKTFTMLRIYNKWGNIVFQTTDPSPEKGWDGSFHGNTSFMETFTWIAEGYDYVGNFVHKTGSTLLLK